jgi:hypothetical protein
MECLHSLSLMLVLVTLQMLLCANTADACLIKKVCSNSTQCKDLIAENAACGVDWKEAAWSVRGVSQGAHDAHRTSHTYQCILYGARRINRLGEPRTRDGCTHVFKRGGRWECVVCLFTFLMYAVLTSFPSSYSSASCAVVVRSPGVPDVHAHHLSSSTASEMLKQPTFSSGVVEVGSFLFFSFLFFSFVCLGVCFRVSVSRVVSFPRVRHYVAVSMPPTQRHAHLWALLLQRMIYSILTLHFCLSG